MSQSAEEPSTDVAFRPFPAFALIWGITTLVHQLAFTFWVESWQGWTLVFSAIAVIVRPGCVMRFAVLVGAALLNLWHKLPFVPNHILFEGLVHLMMLIALVEFFRQRGNCAVLREAWPGWRRHLPLIAVAAILKWAYFTLPFVPQGYALGAPTTLFVAFAVGRMAFRGPEVRGGDDLLARFAPVFRVAVVVVYVWSVVQKLNHDFLDPEVSCATKLHEDIAAYFGGLIPTGVGPSLVAIWGSLAFELGIPLLLVFRRTRLLGFVAAIGFHLWLAIHPAAGIYSFSALVMAFLALFLPSTWGREFQRAWNAQLRWLGRGDPERGRRRARRLPVIGFFIALFIQAGLYMSMARDYETFLIANRVGFFAFLTWGCWIGGCYLVAGWRARREDRALPHGPRRTLAWVVLAPVVLNGVIPWIGLRTQTSFSMYSNLRSEGDGNHLFLERIDLFDYQRDMVEVVESQPDILAPGDRPKGISQFANRQFDYEGTWFLPWFEFRRLVSQRSGDFRVVYVRDGETRTLGREDGAIFGNEAAFEPIPLPLQKLLWFRRLRSLEGPMVCTH